MRVLTLFVVSMLLTYQLLNSEQILVSNFSESEYESVERVFANNTGHIDHLVDFVSTNLISENEPKGCFLDIGAGPATITTRLSQYFESTTVIEPNKAFTPIYEGNNFTYYIGNFQDNLDNNSQYDLVLCSHVLYHIPHEEWSTFLMKFNESIRAGGNGIVTLVAPQGKLHELRSSINSDYSNSSLIEKILKEQNISYDVAPIQSVFKVPNYEDFRALVRLFTIDDCYLPDAYGALSESTKIWIDQKIEDYIATCLQPDGSYEFVDEDVYILIHKD